MGYKHDMLETILAELRHELLTRAPLDALPDAVWRRTGALNTWGTNAIEGNTLTFAEVEQVLLRQRSVSDRPVPDVLETIHHDEAFRTLLARRASPITLVTVTELHEAVLRVAMGRSLLDLLDQVGTKDDELKPLRALAAKGPYGAKYLALRSNQGELPALKVRGDWRTSGRALRIYRETVGRA